MGRKSQPRPQGFFLKKTPHPFFKGKALGTRLQEKYGGKNLAYVYSWGKN